ncbi:hypothetical protein IPC965_10515 [Pseudomonas aeruginosa]|nr:hypothetical protein IPC965_10515 [Pseudomonas aeruginosa]
MIEGTLTAVGKSNDGHGASSPSGDPHQRPRGLGCASKRRPPGRPASQWQAPCGTPAPKRADGDHWEWILTKNAGADPARSAHGKASAAS